MLPRSWVKVCLVWLSIQNGGAAAAPNIIFILADDVGFNDINISFHNPDMMTPNLEKLAASGTILEQSYVLPSCSPSRAALLTGLHPIHTGRQSEPLQRDQATGLDANLKLLPEYLQDLGYKCHITGKWHLGFCNEKYLPTRRGFSSFLGFTGGGIDYYEYSASHHGSTVGYDFYDGDTPVHEKFKGQYTTHIYTQRAQQIIREHNTSQPLFLYLPYQSAHGPNQVPKKYEDMYKNIKDEKRRIFSGQVTAMDEGIGNITRTLIDTGMFHNTMFIFLSDNGGIAGGGGSNYPLKGGKWTLWEGGTRVISFITGPMVKQGVSEKLFHVTDWLPTLVAAAGGDTDTLKHLDGINQWDSLIHNTTGPRTEFLYNIDSKFYGSLVGAIRVGDYKLIRGLPEKPYGGKGSTGYSQPNNSLRYLFNLKTDPFEENNIAKEYPDIVEDLERKLDEYHATSVAPDVLEADPAADPSNFNGIWSTGWC